MHFQKISALVITAGLFISTQSHAAPHQPEQLNQSGDIIKSGQSIINFDKAQLTAVTPKNTESLYHDNLAKAQQQKSIATNSSAESNALTKTWGLYTYGSGIGATGFYTANLNSEEGLELVFASGSGFAPNNKVSILSKKNDGFEIINQFAIPDDDRVTSILGMYDQSSDNHLLFMATGFGKLLVYNLTAKRWQEKLADMYANKLLSYDIDNDGNKELVAIGSNETKIFNITSNTLLHSYDFGGDSGVVGSFTSAESIEIVLSDGDVYTIDGADSELIWSYSEGFGYLQLASDINDDGIDELIAAKPWYDLSAYDVVNQSQLWSHTSDLDIDALYVFDTNDDGKEEVIYGDGQWGSIHALNSSNGESLWNINNPEHGVTQIMIADLDNDTDLEIFWGSGYSSSGSDFLYVHDLESKQHEWNSVDISSIFYAYDIADVDNDGQDEIVAISNNSNSGYDEGVIYVFNATTYEVEWTSENSSPFENQAWTGIHDLEIADVDGDNKNEIIVATDRLYDGAIYVLDGTNGAVKYSKIYDEGSPIYAVKAVDIDNNGTLEIIASSGKEHTGSPGKYIYILNGADGEIIQQSPSLNQNWKSLRHLEILDFTQDGQLDVVVVGDGNINVYDVENNTLLKSNDTDIIDVSYGLIENKTELLAVNNAQELISIDENFDRTVIGQVCSSGVQHISRLNNSRLLFSCSQEIGLYNLIDNNIEWTQTVTSTPWEVIAKVASDSISLLVGGNSLSLYQLTQDSDIITALDQSIETHAKQTINGTLATELEWENKNYFITVGAIHGKVEFTDRVTGEFTYTPDGDFVGEDAFSFIAMNNSTESNEAQVNITLTNQLPTSTDQNFTLHWNGQSTFELAAEDLDNDTLHFELLDLPNRGQLTLADSSTGSISFTPSGTSIDPVTFRFNVTDGLAQPQDYSVIISFSNSAPIASNQSLETYYSTTLSSRLIAQDDDDDSLTYEVITFPSTGEFSYDTTNGLFEYSPAGESSYTTSVEFKVFDGFEYSATQKLTINVEGKSEPQKDSGGGGSLGIFSLLFLLLLLSKRVISNRSY